MPRYTVTDPKSGKKVILTGDSPPTEAELEDIFTKVHGPQDATAEAAPADAGGKISLSQMFLPATNEYAAAHGNEPSLGRYGAMAKDALSLPKRLVDAYAAEGTGDPNKVTEAVTRTKPESIGDAIAREAPLMLTPGLKVAGSGAMRIVSALGSGAAQALPSVAVHQLERKTEGQDLSASAAAGELATGALPVGLTEAGGQVLRGAIPYAKRAVAKLSEVNQGALDAVAHPVTGPQALQDASAAARRFGNADGGTDLTPMAEQLGKRVEAENAQRVQAVETARAAQTAGLEKDALGVRNQFAGVKAKRIGDLSAGDRGEAIKFQIEAAKPAMQTAYTEGDKAAYGGLRAAPAATQPVERFGFDSEPTLLPDGQGGLVEGERTARSAVENVPILPDKIKGVLGEFKALGPDQGVARISPAATSAIKAIGGMAEQAKTVDDLVNMKWQVRHMQASGGYNGALFDATRDDLALNKVMDQIRDVEGQSIREAAPKQADQILKLVDANNELYGRTVQILRKGDQRFRLTQNSENIIGKIKAMGPEEARTLMTEAASNKVLQPYIGELRKGFVDDLLLNSVKNGEFSPAQLAKNWADLSDDLKQAWMDPKTIKQMDQAISKGTQEIADPEKVGQALFGGQGNEFLAEKKLANITGASQKEALAELRTLDALFGTEYTKDAVAAYQGKQLQLGETGKLPAVGNIRTGKAQAVATGMGAAGASLGATVAGPLGAGLGGTAGYGLGFFMQSPAGAVLAFRALNRLQKAGVSDATKSVVSQGLRSTLFEPKAQRMY